MDQEIKQEFENLAVMIQQGFEEAEKKLELFKFETANNFEENRKDHTRINERIDRLYTNVDAFIHMHQKLDLELTALRGFYQRLEERLAKLETAH